MGDSILVRVGCEEPSAGGAASAWVDACHPVAPYASREEQMEAFGLPEACAQPVRFGDVELDVREGASVNCHEVTLCPHGSGTHTECMGHITEQRVAVTSCCIPTLASALLVTVRPRPARAEDLDYAMQEEGDRLITREMLESGVRRHLRDFSGERKLDALCVRALGASYSKEFHRSRKFTNTNPPYFTRDAMEFMLSLGVRHLLVDLPSVDREESGPSMPNHCMFFGLEPGCRDAKTSIRPRSTITESCNFHAGLADGEYVLSLQVSPIEMDAAPSRPLLLPVAAATRAPPSRAMLAAGAAGLSVLVAAATMAVATWAIPSSSSSTAGAASPAWSTKSSFAAR